MLSTTLFTLYFTVYEYHILKLFSWKIKMYKKAQWHLKSTAAVVYFGFLTFLRKWIPTHNRYAPTQCYFIGTFQAIKLNSRYILYININVIYRLNSSHKMHTFFCMRHYKRSTVPVIVCYVLHLTSLHRAKIDLIYIWIQFSLMNWIIFSNILVTKAHF